MKKTQQERGNHVPRKASGKQHHHRNDLQTKPPRADQFIKKAQQAGEVQYHSSRVIKDLPVHESILSNLLRKGYISPTEIQDRSIEPILNVNDLMGLAQTGTGKTGAYLIPLAHNLLGKNPSWQILVITPTRELALQVEQEF